MRLFSPHKAAAPEDRTHNPEVLNIISKVIKLSAENVRLVWRARSRGRRRTQAAGSRLTSSPRFPLPRLPLRLRKSMSRTPGRCLCPWSSTTTLKSAGTARLRSAPLLALPLRPGLPPAAALAQQLDGGHQLPARGLRPGCRRQDLRVPRRGHTQTVHPHPASPPPQRHCGWCDPSTTIPSPFPPAAAGSAEPTPRPPLSPRRGRHGWHGPPRRFSPRWCSRHAGDQHGHHHTGSRDCRARVGPHVPAGAPPSLRPLPPATPQPTVLTLPPPSLSPRGRSRERSTPLARAVCFSPTWYARPIFQSPKLPFCPRHCSVNAPHPMQSCHLIHTLFFPTPTPTGRSPYAMGVPSPWTQAPRRASRAGAREPTAERHSLPQLHAAAGVPASLPRARPAPAPPPMPSLQSTAVQSRREMATCRSM